LIGLVVVFGFRYRDRQRTRKELLKQQQFWYDDSTSKNYVMVVAKERSGSASAAGGNATGIVDSITSDTAAVAAAIVDGGTEGGEGVGIGIEETEAESPTSISQPMTSFRHEAFMALVKEAARGFYAPSLDQDSAPAGSSSSAAAAALGTSDSDHHQALGGTVDPRNEAIEVQDYDRPEDEGSDDDGNLQYLDTGSPSTARRQAHILPHIQPM
jgi:hypothetical protein